MSSLFKLHSAFKPMGDQPQAIDTIFNHFKNQEKFQTLLGVTGSGKTFTMANIIQKLLFWPTTKRWRPSFLVSSKNFFLRMLSNILFLITTTISRKLMFLEVILISKKIQQLMMRLRS